MMPNGLFINGVFESVLEEILLVQVELPEQMLFLQPYSSAPMVQLQHSPPSVASPMDLYLSITTDLSHVHYKGQVVGWDDKRQLTPARRKVLERVLWALQPNEGGLYDMSRTPDKQSANLLRVWRIERVNPPFSVDQLTKFFGGQVSMDRKTAGGWTYLNLTGPLAQ